jgi:hypothetical protein
LSRFVAESSHRVQGRSTVDYVHIEEREQRKDEVRGILATQVPLLCNECMLDGLKGDDLLEELEAGFALLGVGKICEGRVPTAAQLDTMSVDGANSDSRPG